MQENDDNNFQKENEKLKKILTFTQNKLKESEKSYDELKKNYKHSVALEKELMNRRYESNVNKYKGKVVKLREQLKQISPEHNNNASPSMHLQETESPKLFQSKYLNNENLFSTPYDVGFSPTKDSLFFVSDDDQLIFLSKENEQLRKEIHNSKNLKAFKEKQNQIDQLNEQTRILVELVEMYKHDASQYRTSIEELEFEKKRESLKMKKLYAENKKQTQIINNLNVIIESYGTEIESLRKSLIKQKLQFTHKPQHKKIFQSEIDLQRSKSAFAPEEEKVSLKQEEDSERLSAFQTPLSSKPERIFHEPLSELKSTIPETDITFGKINSIIDKSEHKNENNFQNPQKIITMEKNNLDFGLLKNNFSNERVFHEPLSELQSTTQLPIDVTFRKIDFISDENEHKIENKFQNPKKLITMEKNNLDIGLLKKKFSNEIQKLKEEKIYTENDLCNMLQKDLTFDEFQELCADKNVQNELLRSTLDTEKQKYELEFKQERERIEKENAQLKSELSVLNEKSKMMNNMPKEENWVTNLNLWSKWNKRI